MSDSNISSPDTVLGDAEPSMEDILASIRKVIAADKKSESNANGDTFATDLEIVELENDSEEDILDLVSFVDENTQADLENEDVAPPIEDENSIFNLKPVEKDKNSAKNSIDSEAANTNLEDANIAINFDETLDLVMDADASDFETTRLEPVQDVIEASTPAPDLEPEFETLEIETVEIEVPSIETLDIETPDTEAQNTDTQDVETETLEAALSPEPETQIEQETVELDISANDDLILESEDLSVDNTDVLSAETIIEDDMDLVKSLLSGLMDEPETSDETLIIEEVEHSTLDADGDDDVNSVLDELLETSIEVEDQDSEPSDEVELSDIAKMAAAQTDTDTQTPENPDDEVILETPDLKAQLALLGAASVATGAAVLSSDDEEDELEIEAETEIETELETNIEQEPLSETKEEKPMATRVTKTKLVDEETERETSEVFASLTTVVREKSELEENGPPIGDLVQEALTPMLQAWLDKNLKGIVERAVKAEVKRISSGK